MYIQGAVDGVNPPEASKNVPTKFGLFKLEKLDGVGHFPTREAPDEVSRILVRQFTGTSKRVT